MFKKEGFAEENGSLVNIDPEDDLRFDFDSNFSIIMHEKNLLVVDFSSYSDSGGAHGMPGESYLHVNLQTGKAYKLSDLFKPQSGYLKEINRILKKQIEEEGEDKGVYSDSLTQFDEIMADQSFYIDNETLHIVFNPYEIGPYSAGFITFDILFKDLESSINKKGAFWKSFH
jgi:hypothetical protein